MKGSQSPVYSLFTTCGQETECVFSSGVSYCVISLNAGGEKSLVIHKAVSMSTNETGMEVNK